MLSIFLWGCNLILRGTPAGSTKMAYIASRMAGIEALVDYGTFAIDKSQFKTIDRVQIGDTTYSSKPPLLYIYGAGVYWTYKQITGGTINDAYRTITLAIGFFPHMVLLIFFFLGLRRFITSPIAQVLAYTGMAAGYIGTFYARIINNHSVAAALLFISLYLAMRIRINERRHWSMWVIVGFVAGVLPTVDVPSAAFAVGLAVYLFCINRRKTLTFFLPAFVIPLSIHFAIMYSFTAGILPVQVRDGLGYGLFDIYGKSTWIYFYHMMIGKQGIFAFSPVALLGIVEILRQILFRGKFWREGVLVIFALSASIFYYVFHTYNYGGMAVSFRWLIPILPALIFFAGILLDRFASSRFLPVLCLLFIFLTSINLKQMENEQRPLRSSVWAEMYEKRGLQSYPCLFLGKCSSLEDAKE